MIEKIEFNPLVGFLIVNVPCRMMRTIRLRVSISVFNHTRGVVL